ncbi:hypothetical protein TRFO_28965 [Tritrichomonas foetus]|uniref:UBX domain-containing protein n=1 Tax=Tritrichomonas foetus TaxID=1144522 RepID=A0A1J4K285_9EUKA|nr:hypothetical protein TRFO_28965 [Tritrichomonas foetus]|eukprot:OHT03597.1 hypothetical protein TRFO_28965 [Tritrichomonas foetus]
METFSHDLHGTMMLKGQHPEYMVVVSLEKDFSELDSFWKNPDIGNHIDSSKGVYAVRLSETENPSEIQQFEFIFKCGVIPSLHIFAPNETAIAKSWTDTYPTVAELEFYLDDYLKKKIIHDQKETEPTPSSSPQSSQSTQSSPQSPPRTRQPIQLIPPSLSTSREVNGQKLNSNGQSIIPPPNSIGHTISRPRPKSPHLSNSSAPLIYSHQSPQASTSNSDHQSSNGENSSQPQATTRISIHASNRTIKRVFPVNATLADLRAWFFADYGRSPSTLIIAHLHSPLPDDDSMTLSAADLVPSAALREQVGESLRDDDTFERTDQNRSQNSNNPNDIAVEGVIGRPNNNSNGICGRTVRFIRWLACMLNPWGGNEPEDPVDWEYQPDPDYAPSLAAANGAAQMNQDMGDTFRPSRL